MNDRKLEIPYDSNKLEILKDTWTQVINNPSLQKIINVIPLTRKYLTQIGIEDIDEIMPDQKDQTTEGNELLRNPEQLEDQNDISDGNIGESFDSDRDNKAEALINQGSNEIETNENSEVVKNMIQNGMSMKQAIQAEKLLKQGVKAEDIDKELMR